MDVLTALDTRRSIRRFLPGTISEAQLQTILKAGLSAPSAHNRRPFHFVIISEEETKRTLQEKSVYGRMIMESALLIAVCGDTKIQPVHDFLIEDCSAATENILMAAHGNHLGAVWVGVYALGGWQRTIQEVLKLPENILPVALIPIGIPGEKPVFRNRFEKEKIHYQRW
jgi:nitroreductase